MKQKLLWAGIGGGLVILTAVIVVGFTLRAASGLSARTKPTALEAFAAAIARDMAMPAEAKSRQNPVAPSPENLAEAKQHWADHCAGCHANNGSGDNTMGKQMYPPAPDMRIAKTQNLTDGELFYIIENGIRLTGMPGWGNGTESSASASWKLVRFIRHLPSLTSAEISEMENMNPKSPADLEEERQEAEFLNGGSSPSTKESHHH